MNAKPGEIISFGTYPQRVDRADNIPIKWRVLQNSSSELFILSEYILDCKRYQNDCEPYHSEHADITWRDCDLRKWLNNEFYNTTFNTAEKKRIKITHCSDNGKDSPDTKDKVFLPSAAEVKEVPKDMLRALGTQYAKIKKADGCHLYVYDKSVPGDYLTINGMKHGCSWWWLRTRGNNSSRAFFIGTRASIRSYGRVNLSRYGVRPALKLKI